MSGGRSASTSSNASTQVDSRIAQESGAAISGNNSAITINSTDAGIVSRALDSVDIANTANSDNFTALLDTSGQQFGALLTTQRAGMSDLLDFAGNVLQRGESLIQRTQSGIADAYRSATSDKAGGIDNRTIIVLAVAGAVAVFALRKK